MSKTTCRSGGRRHVGARARRERCRDAGLHAARARASGVPRSRWSARASTPRRSSRAAGRRSRRSTTRRSGPSRTAARTACRRSAAPARAARSCRPRSRRRSTRSRSRANGALNVVQRIPIHLKAGAVNPARAWMEANPNAGLGMHAGELNNITGLSQIATAGQGASLRPAHRCMPRATRSRTPPTASRRCRSDPYGLDSESIAVDPRDGSSGSATSTARRSCTSPPTGRCSTGSCPTV